MLQKGYTLHEAHAAATPVCKSVTFAAFQKTTCTPDRGAESDAGDSVVTPSHEAEELKYVEVRQPEATTPPLCASSDTCRRCWPTETHNAGTVAKVVHRCSACRRSTSQQ